MVPIQRYYHIFFFIGEKALDPSFSNEDFEDRKVLLSSIISELHIVMSNLYQLQLQNYILKDPPMHLNVFCS